MSGVVHMLYRHLERNVQIHRQGTMKIVLPQQH